jgi:hypothetical protein
MIMDLSVLILSQYFYAEDRDTEDSKQNCGNHYPNLIYYLL